MGVYSKQTKPGDASPEAQRRWHVWSLDNGQFLTQEIFPGGKAPGESQRVDSVDFFNSYRVHAAFSTGVKQTPSAPPAAKTQKAAAPQAKKPEAKKAQPQKDPPVVSRAVFEELEKDDGLSESVGQAKAVVTEEEEGLYPMRPDFEVKDDPKSATFYTKKALGQKTRPLITELEKVEEQMRSDFSLALIRLQTNRDMAIKSLNKIVETRADFGPKQKYMFSEFGTALRRRHLYSLAFLYHERAKGLAPDDEHILFNMARAMFDSGKVDNARKYLQQAVAMSRDFQAGIDFLEFINGKYPRR